MADNFQLKAIITAVDRLSGPLKGMQRQLKGFQKRSLQPCSGRCRGGYCNNGGTGTPCKISHHP